MLLGSGTGAGPSRTVEASMTQLNPSQAEALAEFAAHYNTEEIPF